MVSQQKGVRVHQTEEAFCTVGKLRDEEEQDNLQDIALKVCRHHRKLDSREMNPKSDPNSIGMVVLHLFFCTEYKN